MKLKSNSTPFPLTLFLQGDQIGIAPRMFKALVGRGHPEFSTNRQQDAQEFLLHFINMVEVNLFSLSFCLSSVLFKSASFFPFSPPPLQRNCRSGANPSEAFRFLVEEKIVCQQSQKAKYTQRVDYIVQLPVPMDHATNTGEEPRFKGLRCQQIGLHDVRKN